MASILDYAVNVSTAARDIRAILLNVGLLCGDFYMVHNGHIVDDDDVIPHGIVHIFFRVLGGKGGFGSMLRAIGAQIEKTTNREACRDLSGRRLRDINEEQRLKNWIALQADREREAAERKQKKLERLQAEPKHEFKDAHYDKERSELTNKVNDAIEQGFKASTSGSGVGQKRKAAPATSTAPINVKKKKSALLWLDADEEDLSSSDEIDDDDASVGTENKDNTTHTEDTTNQSKEMSDITVGITASTVEASLQLAQEKSVEVH